MNYTEQFVGRFSVVGIATPYEQDGPGMESRGVGRGGGARFFAPVQIGPRAKSASYSVDTRYFPGVKRPGRCINHPPPSRAEVIEGVQLYIYSHSGLSWSVLG